MKKTACCMFILILFLSFSACSQSPAAVNQSYSGKIEEIAQLPSSNDIVGISPDGKYVFFYNGSDIKALIIEAQPGGAEPSFSPAMSLTLGDDAVSPKKKKLQWSKDGQSFIFSDVDYASQELIVMKSWNVSLFSIENGGLSARSATDEDTKFNIAAGTGRIVYAPSFSYDGKGIVYSAIGTDSGVYKVDLASGEKKTIYAVEGHKDIDCLELGEDLSICCMNGSRADEGCKLFFVDGRGGVTNIGNGELGLEDGLNQFDVKAWSEDRRTLLLTRRNNSKVQGVFDAFFLIRIKNGSNDYEVKSYAMPDGMFVYNAALSPDGRYVVSCETKDAAADGNALRMKQLTLYDVSAGTKIPLYSSDAQFGFTSPLNGNHESIFLTKNGKLLVWFGDGYKLFQLK
jgi:Tol biopolymer transport system component